MTSQHDNDNHYTARNGGDEYGKGATTMNDTQFTTKDFKAVKGHVSGRAWYTLEIQPMKWNGTHHEGLYLDIAVSRWDKRDLILSVRRDWTLDQDGGFVEAYSKRYTTLTQVKAIGAAVANAVAAGADTSHCVLARIAREADTAQ